MRFVAYAYVVLQTPLPYPWQVVPDVCDASAWFVTGATYHPVCLPWIDEEIVLPFGEFEVSWSSCASSLVVDWSPNVQPVQAGMPGILLRQGRSHAYLGTVSPSLEPVSIVYSESAVADFLSNSHPVNRVVTFSVTIPNSR